MNAKKYELGKAPFIRKADITSQNTSHFMLDFIIALIPLILFGWVKNGLLPFIDKDTNFLGLIYPLLLPIFGGLFSLLLELFWWGVLVKNKPLKERMATSYAVIPGLLLGMIVSVSTPLWVLFIGTIFATVIAKLLFGGFGHNIFNPALIGYLFLISYAYFGLMNGQTGVNVFGASGYFNPTEVGTITAGATPMAVFSADRFAGVDALIGQYGLLNMFLGLIPGSLAETSALLCLLALVYLLVRKVINWRIPVIYIGTVFVLTYVIGAFNGYADTLDYALFGIFNGGLMFGAVFMATEPVTSPRNPNGKIIYAIGIGLLTVVFRFASKSPEGVAISILTMNIFTALIERIAAKLRVEPNKKKVILTYSLIGLLFAGIATFPVVKSLPTPVVVPAYEFVDAKQDYKSLDLVYNFKSGDVEFSVVTDQASVIKSVSNAEYNTADAKAVLGQLINDNKIVNYIVSASETADSLVLTINTKGYAGNILNTITYDNNNLITAFTTTYTESYFQEYNEGWTEANGHPRDKVPGSIIANQDNLENVEVVAGATVTSQAIIRAVEVGKGYLAYLDTITELTLVGKSQDLETLDLVYAFRNADGKILVKTNANYEISSTVDAAIKAEIEAEIAKNKFEDYIVSATATTITVKTKGFKNTVNTTFTFDETYAITNIAITYDESYSEEYNEGWSGTHPKDVLPSRIIDNQADLTQVEVVAGATVTSKAIVRAAEIAKNYLNVLEAANE